MAWIEASAAGGGSTGGGNTIMVTCSESFAGLPITCTNGLTTKTLNCPSTAPYVIQFTDIVADEWTISGTIDGTTYSTTVEVGDIFTTVLESGFEWQTWVDLSQNYHSADYNSLAEVFADEGALHELMTIHACCDYLIDAVSDDISTIDDFVANDNAMKWIGLRDYVCDGLTAITGVEAKFLASQYWERYLKDHVPVMTANNAPYGVASANGNQSGYDAYKAFDGNLSIPSTSNHGWLHNGNNTTEGKTLGYEFTNPTKVEKAVIVYNLDDTSTCKIQGSNDGGNTWVDVSDTITLDSSENQVNVNINATTYYKKYQLYSLTGKFYFGYGVKIQFYGRSLNVSVPVMTSNTAPYGEAFDGGHYTDHLPWKAFDNQYASNTQTNEWQSQNNNITGGERYVGYDFGKSICVKMAVEMLGSHDSNNGRPRQQKYQGWNGTEWVDLLDITSGLIDLSWLYHNIPNSNGYEKYRAIYSDIQGDANWSTRVKELQFYGVDYSEREFEPNTNKKWLYDHGLNLGNLEAYVVNPGSDDYVTFESDYINVHYTGVSGGGRRTVAKTSMDLTNYNLAKAVIDDFGASSLILGVFASDSSTSSIAQVDLTKPFNYLDISSVDSNASVQVGRYISGNTGYGKVTELWLEY